MSKYNFSDLSVSGKLFIEGWVPSIRSSASQWSKRTGIKLSVLKVAGGAVVRLRGSACPTCGHCSEPSQDALNEQHKLSGLYAAKQHKNALKEYELKRDEYIIKKYGYLTRTMTFGAVQEMYKAIGNPPQPII